MIQIDHLIKEFDAGIRAVNDISLHVEAGEVFGFLGPNGAGKTTTIKILTTLLRPTSGTVTVAGHDVLEDPLAVRMSFGYVGQQSGVDPALTVLENMLLQGRLYHLPKKKIEERIKTLLQLFDMTGREGQWVGSLSGGLKRRLDIATALIHEPKLLFLDEPTIGLDPKSRADLWAYLRGLNRDEGMTLFLTTHYLDEVDQLANRVGILDGGQIRIVGTPDQLKDSLGQDAIHLAFDEPITEETLAAFRNKDWFKEVIQQGEAIRLYLENGQQLLPKVIQWVDSLNLSAKSVLLARPTFDDVYLKYTGKNWLLADEAAEEDWGGWGGSKNNKWAKKWADKAGSSKSEWVEGPESEGNQDWKKWAGQGAAQWSKGDHDPKAVSDQQEADTKHSPDPEKEHTEDSRTADSSEPAWKKWGDQANSEWSSEESREPVEEKPEKKVAKSEDAPAKAEADSEEPWKKWGGQADSNWSSDKKSGSGQNWSEGGEQPQSEWPKDDLSEKSQDASTKDQKE